MKRALLIVLVATVTSACAGKTLAEATSGELSPEVRTMKIRINIEKTVLTATLSDNATSRDFVALLPLTLTLKDYASTEKVADLPKRLSTAGAPAGTDPDVGDITYYAPWGNLAIFYRDVGYADGLVKLGTIDGDIEPLKRSGTFEVTIEKEESR